MEPDGLDTKTYSYYNILRLLKPILGGTLAHTLDAGLGLGVRREHLVDIAGLRACALLHFEKLLKSLDHTPGVATVLHQKVIATVIGLFLLLLRELCSGERFAESAELRLGKGCCHTAGRGHGILERACKQLLLESILAVTLHHVTYLMTDNTHQSVIVHNVHQRRKHSNAAVGTCESIHIDYLIHLEIQRYTVGIL